jgi:uncharacterized protein (UPF0264 family)
VSFNNWQQKTRPAPNIHALFFVGENEKIYTAMKAIQRLNSVDPYIHTEIIPDAGDDLALVQTDMVNRKVLEFLKQA